MSAMHHGEIMIPVICVWRGDAEIKRRRRVQAEAIPLLGQDA